MLTAAARIRRLRRRLTALFALTSAVGLVALSALAVKVDGDSHHHQLDDSLKIQTSAAIPQLGADDNGALDVSAMLEAVDADCPPLTVFAVHGTALQLAYTAKQPCAKVRPADAEQLAAAALRLDGPAWADRTGTDDHPLRLMAAPFTGADGQTTAGVMVSAADASHDQSAHRQLILLLAGGCAVLVTVSSVIGHLLSGRATRPALTALQQQEAFLADAAHDLRTPVAALRTLAETALAQSTRPVDGAAAETMRTAALQRTVRLAGRMGDLVDGLLTRARLAAGVGELERSPLRLDQLADTVLEELPQQGQQVTTRLEPVVVNGDPDLLRRAIANLLGNALAHGHAPGRPAEIELTVTADGTLTVDDAGPGLPPEHADTLFERFHSTSGSTGLGLSIASWVAHAHGGTLTAGPSPRGGARFTLRIPAHRR
ncbi:sensor histidine kinase [Kitasatospora viridis]|uniref:histidine kinase n=1 Tax=Kitasatospora viridis TaxID=281105 RepID=A0A561S927_9ACTN|nr:HAMP domain-containing sensor histidine kinase [Kitasatospora viridis]TWF71379.1 two-component system OmpR family sensor kinase [Kitasatospora viridis]